MRLKNLSPDNSKLKKVIIIVVLLIVLCTVFILYKKTLGVVVKDNKSFEYPQIAKSVEDLNSEESRVYIGQNYPQYVVISDDTDFLGKRSIILNERMPEILLKASNGSFFVDNELFVFPLDKRDVSGLPKVIFNENIQVNNYVKSQMLINGLKYSKHFPELYVENQMIQLKDYQKLPIVVLPDNIPEDFDKFQETLQKINQKYTIEGKKVELVDLRFSNPVIKYR